MAKWQIHWYNIRQRLGFFRSAKTLHQIDSPFVCHFVKEVIEDQRQFYIFPIAKEIQDELAEKETKVHTIPPKVGAYLFKIIHTYKPEIMLELGTSNGISAIYQAAAALGGDLISINQDTTAHQTAEKIITELGLPNISLVDGNFVEVLPDLLAELPQVDYVFLNGDQDIMTRLTCFEYLLPKLTEKSILVCSGIYWSEDKKASWAKMKAHPKVRLSIDLFDIGVLFFNPIILEKQHFKLVPMRWKFWRLGLFRYFS